MAESDFLAVMQANIGVSKVYASDAPDNGTDISEVSQKVYYSDGYVQVGSKLWTCHGTNSLMLGECDTMYFPVSSISCVEHVYHPLFWLWFVLAGVMFILQIIFYVEVADAYYLSPSWTIAGVVCTIVFVWALIKGYLRSRQGVAIYSHNAKASYFLVVPQSQIEKYLKPMRKCLLENAG